MKVAVDSGSFGAAADTCRTANQISALLCESLAGKLAGCSGMAGDDSSSVEFAASYDEGAREAVATLAELTHAFVGLGRLLSASGANHRDAEAASAGVSAYAGRSLDDDDYVRVSPATSPSSLGSNPHHLGAVETWILDQIEGFVWPGADADLLREAAATWRRTGSAVADLDGHCAVAVSLLERQVSPEIPLALDALAEIRAHVGDTADALTALATSCEQYAEAVIDAHERTRALLAEIGRMVVEGAAISVIVGGLTGGLGAGAAGAAAVARVSAQAPRFHALLTTLRLAGATNATRLRAARDGLATIRTRVEKFARVPARNERGSVRLPGGGGGVRKPGWLRAHDTPPGHTIDKHVGKTVDELIEQCARDRKRLASSFATEADAERFVGEVIAKHANEIRQWLTNGTRRTLPLESELGQATGTTVTRAGAVSSATGVRIVLIPKPGTPDGWQILTAFPN